ncbi:MAG: hypothetical protein GY769_07310 [bacterium]|nr:hypothetical protein [bacterium]
MKIGIRREDKSRWERRIPLTPTDLAALSEDPGLEFVVQPSPIRVFDDEDFRRAGVEIDEDLSSAEIVLAVKEIPVDLLAAEKIYVFFSHVIKGQPHNMPMLARLMELGCSLVDYEKIVDDAGRRLIFFGVHAGHAGAIETLWCLSQRLRAAGLPDALEPLSEIRHAYEYESLTAAKAHLSAVGERIRERASGPGDRPLIFGIAGYGNVARGCREVLDSLGVAEIAVADLAAAAAGEVAPLALLPPLLRVVFKEEDMVELRRDSSGAAEPRDEDTGFDLQDYYDHPKRYRGCFERHLPHLDVLINAAYWDERYPRLVTREWARRSYTGGRRPQESRRHQEPRLMVIGDISCDLEGGIELTTRTTEPDSPCFTYVPQSDSVRMGCDGPGPAIMAVDNLPCELPREASEEFSRALRAMVAELAGADWRAEFEQLELAPHLKNAVIVHRGELTPDYRYLGEHLKDA